ncbi:hypothetical protein [Sediminicoccus rosea]|jgi:hypothetical protein|uniref:Cysteine rich repeat-containing protein n=1 Tax=Sediminicoccus rosea TaxID=1225128 RepID=A0ABZ0PJC3_9PROT|nr:hypothetical protein [Sediminicoccus rosea]WPB85497.1 hypothetical protein R9Z33_01165 [Sediminicoccus rosea]
MRLPLIATLLTALLAWGSPGFAQLQDAAGWIRQCLDATANRGASAEMRGMYCTCMVAQANDAGAATLAALEQANPEAARQCRELSGWR